MAAMASETRVASLKVCGAKKLGKVRRPVPNHEASSLIPSATVYGLPTTRLDTRQMIQATRSKSAWSTAL